MSLAEYEIGPLGFLEENCIQDLPASWTHYQPLLDNLASHDCENFRSLVTSLPTSSVQQYSTKSLTTPQKKFLHSVLSMIIQKYIWGNETSRVLGIIPKEIGLPFYEISNDLKLPTILCYADYILYNWSYRDPNQPFSLENIRPNFIPCHTFSQEWFSRIHMATEAEGSKALKSMLEIKKGILKGDNSLIKQNLQEIITAIKGCAGVLVRMYEHCTPRDLHRFTRYFGGTNYPDVFPNGLQIEGFDHKPIILKKITGGQSTTIHSFDAFFSIKHEGHGKGFLEELVTYMPAAHQRFLRDLRAGITLTDYVEKCQDNELVDLFHKGINSLIHLRQTHLEFLHRYTAKPSEKEEVSEKEALDSNDMFRVRLQSIVKATRTAQNSFVQRKMEMNIVGATSGFTKKLFASDVFMSLLVAFLFICLLSVFIKLICA